MEAFFLGLLHELDSWGSLAYLAIFVIAYLESIVFIGLLVPGSLVMIFLGFLAANSSLALREVILLTAFGAWLGDWTSFYLGYWKGRWVIEKLSRFFNKKDYMTIGEDFFAQHGEKSVFIGRFLAVVRPFIPFVAGVFKMNWRSFLFWNVLSAVAWSALYILIGYSFGFAWKSATVWASRVGFLILVAVVFWLVGRWVKTRLSIKK